MRQENLIRYLGSWVFLLAITGCNEASVPAQDRLTQQERSCGPFEELEVPVELGRVVIVGKDSKDTIYVVEEDETKEYRVFVSSGSTLYRKYVAGAGMGSTKGLGEHLSLIIDDGNEEYTVLVEITEDGTATIAVTAGDYEGTINEMSKAGEEEILENLDPATISKMELVNLPGTIEIEYLAKVDNGNWIVVVRPKYFFDDYVEDFRFFYGEESRMVEYEVLDVLRAADGGSTWITVDFNGTEAVAYFESELNGPSLASFEIDGKKNSVTRLKADSIDIERLTFYCIK